MATCAACSHPLTLTVDPDPDLPSSSSAPQTVPDDVHLRCNHHYHWSCLLSSFSHSTCPSCQTPLTTLEPQLGSRQKQESLRVNINNEGGYQQNIDILPLLQEESYLKAYPEERKSRAWLEFVREGDLEGVLELVLSAGEPVEETDDDDMDGESEEDEDDVPQQNLDQILRYTDTLDEGRSALHIAVAKLASQDGDSSRIQQITWLILLLASNLEPDRFPEDVKAAGEQLGLSRGDQTGLEDVRAIKDGNRKTAYDVAIELDLRDGGGFHVDVLAP